MRKFYCKCYTRRRLAWRTFDHLEECQQNLMMQLLDVQRRIDRFEEPNWNLISAKVHLLKFGNKILGATTSRILSQEISDFN